MARQHARRSVRGWTIATFILTIVLGATHAAALNTATDIIGASDLRQLLPHLDGVDDATGQVQRIAIIDTGVDHAHPDLAGRVVGGVNYATGAAWGSTSTTAWTDRHGHGTFVAGAAGSSRDGLLGVAPQVEFVSVRVLAANGEGALSDLAAGIEWVVDHAAELNITTVNISVGSGLYASPDDVHDFSTYRRLRTGLGDLEAMDVVTAAAAGNSGSHTALSVPAIFDPVISVGASTDSDDIASFSNRNAYLELFAPGSGIQSLWDGGGTSYGSGTSYASPLVAGASAIFREAYLQFIDEGDLAGEYASFQDRLTSLWMGTAASIVDPINGATYGRLDMLAAMEALYVEFGEEWSGLESGDSPPAHQPEPASVVLMAVAGSLLITRRRQSAGSVQGPPPPCRSTV